MIRKIFINGRLLTDNKASVTFNYNPDEYTGTTPGVVFVSAANSKDGRAGHTHISRNLEGETVEIKGVFKLVTPIYRLFEVEHISQDGQKARFAIPENHLL